MIRALFLFFSWASMAHALVLEEHHSDLTGRIGYFVGSFDPIHKGHEAFVEKALRYDLVDYVLIYPSWGGDSYKVRSDVTIRLDMLFSLYKDHPKVICTRLTPKALQKAFIRPNIRFIGMVGSDAALYLAPNPETSKFYMTGLEIPEEYSEHTWGSCMALPVDAFIVAMREGYDITCLNGMILERPIIATFDNESERSISCTAIKKELRASGQITPYISPPILTLIKQHNLYANP